METFKYLIDMLFATLLFIVAIPFALLMFIVTYMHPNWLIHQEPLIGGWEDIED